GLLSLEIGTGSTSDDFSAIDWSSGPYFIKTETDPNGGSSYTITGTSQLMSVPFALYAKTSGSSTPGPQGVAGTQGIQGETGATGADGAAGSTSPCDLSIGDTYQGGIIFYLDASGCHGLIAASSDQSASPGIQWYNGSYTDTYASGSGLFSGDGNC
ncbi:MAG: hypothetical protein ACI83H_001522, partial [Glaciecola sp.]